MSANEENKIEFKFVVDSVMVIVLAIVLCATALLWKLLDKQLPDDPPKVTQSQECFGPLQKLVEDKPVCEGEYR